MSPPKTRRKKVSLLVQATATMMMGLSLETRTATSNSGTTRRGTPGDGQPGIRKLAHPKKWEISFCDNGQIIDWAPGSS